MNVSIAKCARNSSKDISAAKKNLQQAEQTSSDFIFKLLYLGCFVFEFPGTSFIITIIGSIIFQFWVLRSSFSIVSFYDRDRNNLSSSTKHFAHNQVHKALVYTSLYPCSRYVNPNEIFHLLIYRHLFAKLLLLEDR